jgi:hypothetical protein
MRPSVDLPEPDGPSIAMMSGFVAKQQDDISAFDQGQGLRVVRAVHFESGTGVAPPEITRKMRVPPETSQSL